MQPCASTFDQWHARGQAKAVNMSTRTNVVKGVHHNGKLFNEFLIKLAGLNVCMVSFHANLRSRIHRKHCVSRYQRFRLRWQATLAQCFW